MTRAYAPIYLVCAVISALASYVSFVSAPLIYANPIGHALGDGGMSANTALFIVTMVAIWLSLVCVIMLSMAWLCLATKDTNQDIES